jgi:hypothetical protein
MADGKWRRFRSVRLLSALRACASQPAILILCTLADDAGLRPAEPRSVPASVRVELASGRSKSVIGELDNIHLREVS